MAQGYWDTLQKQKTAFFKFALGQNSPLVPHVDCFANSRFYWRHALMAADIYLTSSNPETRRLGLDLITRELSRETSEQDPVLFGRSRGLAGGETSREDPAKRFLPALWRIDSILNRLKHFSSEEREALLRESFVLLKNLKTRGDNSLNRATLLIELATVAFRYGHDVLAKEVIGAWEQGLEKQLERSLGKGKPGEPHPREYWAAFRREARIMFDLLRALSEGERGMEAFVSRLEKGGPSLRRRFSIEDYLLAMDYLSRKEIWSQLAKGDAVLESFAREITLRYAESEPEDRLTVWESLVATFQNLPVSAPVLDRIFLYLIKTATHIYEDPRGFGAHPSFLWQAYRPLAYLIGNPAFPESEAFLLKHLSASLRRNQESTPREILGNLDWAFPGLRKKPE